MKYSISLPQRLNITDNDDIWFGGIQEWYADRWQRMSGCGPTCASNILAYLAASGGAAGGLFPQPPLTRVQFAWMMEEVFGYVTPGVGGLNRPELFVSGVEKYAQGRDVMLRSHLLKTLGCADKKRCGFEEVSGFIAGGLSSDCPVAFLNLSAGREKRIQDWHWITLVSLEEKDGTWIAEASDEGKRREFDLRNWYETTKMRGGFAWFSVET